MKEIDYELIRSKRRTLAIHIKADGTVEARVPYGVSKRRIEEFVVSKSKWINNKRKEISEAMDKKEKFSLNYQFKPLIMGHEREIFIGEPGRLKATANGFHIEPGLNESALREALEFGYRKLALRVFTDQTINFAEKMNLHPASVKVSSARTRWGSCSKKGSINFSWYLIMAEIDTIAYVVVHELAHLRYMNHSSKFWQLVESILPDYKERRRSLKHLQYRLVGEGW